MSTLKTMAKRQVAGYYRQKVGDVIVTAIYDGYINLSPSLFHGLCEEDIKAIIDRHYPMQTQEGIATAVTTYLVDNGTDIILINTGGGNNSGQTMGIILENLSLAGYSCEAITAVLLTHMHFDHICGLTNKKGVETFPNATVYVSEVESNFWLNPENAKTAPEENRVFFEMAHNAILPYKNKGKLRTFNSNTQILDNIQAMATPGHTPGHTSFLINSGNDKMLLWGDIVHSHALQFIHPEITNDFDSDQVQAAITRGIIFQKVAEENLLIGGDHLPFPGFGYLKKAEKGYSWLPVEYIL